VEVGLALPDGPADGLHGLADVFFLFFSFLPFWHCIIGLFFYFYILSKTSSYLTIYRLKGKKGSVVLKTMVPTPVVKSNCILNPLPPCNTPCL
jgi:hypothetical protein